MKINQPQKLLLASSSPRRKELLEKAGIEFTTFPVKVSEFLDKNLNLNEAVKNIAREKAMAAVDLANSLNLKDVLILSSDTVVILDGQVLGKPDHANQAYEFLRRLSSQRHEVKTSVCFIDTKTQVEVCEIESSFVTFRDLSDEEIWSYIATGQPMDKAGAYGIQEQGGTFIVKLEGELDNVMGLPVKRVLRMMQEHKWI